MAAIQTTPCCQNFGHAFVLFMPKLANFLVGLVGSLNQTHLNAPTLSDTAPPPQRRLSSPAPPIKSQPPGAGSAAAGGSWCDPAGSRPRLLQSPAQAVVARGRTRRRRGVAAPSPQDPAQLCPNDRCSLLEGSKSRRLPSSSTLSTPAHLSLSWPFQPRPHPQEAVTDALSRSCRPRPLQIPSPPPPPYRIPTSKLTDALFREPGHAAVVLAATVRFGEAASTLYNLPWLDLASSLLSWSPYGLDLARNEDMRLPAGPNLSRSRSRMSGRVDRCQVNCVCVAEAGKESWSWL